MPDCHEYPMFIPSYSPLTSSSSSSSSSGSSLSPDLMHPYMFGRESSYMYIPPWVGDLPKHTLTEKYRLQRTGEWIDNRKLDRDVSDLTRVTIPAMSNTTARTDLKSPVYYLVSATLGKRNKTASDILLHQNRLLVKLSNFLIFYFQLTLDSWSIFRKRFKILFQGWSICGLQSWWTVCEIVCGRSDESWTIYMVWACSA